MNVVDDSKMDAWVDQHFRAADEIIDFMSSDGIDMTGKLIADIGAGDGLISAAIATKCDLGEVVGFDIRQTDVERLRLLLAKFVDSPLPENLSFVMSSEKSIPSEDSRFDFVVSWSTFEHISNPVAMAREIRRILKPDGYVFIQVWPFYNSEWGSHLWDYSSSFEHLIHPIHEIQDRIKNLDFDGDYFGNLAIEMSSALNRIDVDSLQRAFLFAGLVPVKVQLYSEAVHIPSALAHRSLSDIMISGIKAIFIPSSRI